MADLIQIRRDTAVNWTFANPILAQGELGLETDTNKIKVGNGATAWGSLSYVVDAAGYITSETDPVVGAVAGIVKADGAGNISAAVAGTDYVGTETDPVVGAVAGIVKADGAGNISAAVAGTDYVGTETDPVVGAVAGIVKADGAGNISAAVAGTDYQAPLTAGTDYLAPAAIGETVQAYDVDIAKYDDGTANFTGTLQNSGSNVVVDADIGSTVQAYDENLTSFVSTFTLPTTDGTEGYFLQTNGSGNLTFSAASGGSVNFESVASAIKPEDNNFYNIGTYDKRWKQGWFSEEVLAASHSGVSAVLTPDEGNSITLIPDSATAYAVGRPNEGSLNVYMDSLDSVYSTYAPNQTHLIILSLVAFEGSGAVNWYIEGLQWVNGTPPTMGSTQFSTDVVMFYRETANNFWKGFHVGTEIDFASEG